MESWSWAAGCRAWPRGRRLFGADRVLRTSETWSWPDHLVRGRTLCWVAIEISLTAAVVSSTVPRSSFQAGHTSRANANPVATSRAPSSGAEGVALVSAWICATKPGSDRPLLGPFRQLADLRSTAPNPAMLPSPSRLDGRVQRQQVRLIGQLRYRRIAPIC